MNPQTRRIALYLIGAVSVLASVNALVHSYAGLYSWALQHRVSGWQAMTWPAEIDVFLVVGELALYVAYLDGWPGRQRIWPWATAITGLTVSVAGNVGHVVPVVGAPVTVADRVTAAVSPVAAFAGLMIGLLVLKMNGGGISVRKEVVGAIVAMTATGPMPVAGAGFGTDRIDDDPDSCSDPVVVDAAELVRAAIQAGECVSQRALAAELRKRGHRFSNSQLRDITQAARAGTEREAA
jgi:hypothetical protein